MNFPSPHLCITASGNILASGNLCFRVFKLQLKVINKNVCYLVINNAMFPVAVVYFDALENNRNLYISWCQNTTASINIK